MFKCEKCGKEYGDRERVWRCGCGGTLSLRGYDFRMPDKKYGGIWRWLGGLPIDAASVVSMGEGETPLVRREVCGRSAWFKLDYTLPSGSYKDRGMSALVSWLKTVGADNIVEDSSGNAGSSMAAYCAAGGIGCDVYVPDYTSEGKCVQIKSYGANLVRVPGSREDTTHAAVKAGEASFYASHNWSPIFPHGVKTWFLETFEQLPDVTDIVVPVGQGSIAIGAKIAMDDLIRAGVMKAYPRIWAVQPSACDPLAKAFAAGIDEPVTIEKGDTAAEGIASAEPVRGAEVLRGVRDTNGGFVTVGEDEIWSALSTLSRTGIYVEPTSAAAAAGWLKLVGEGRIGADAKAVVYLSGIGLKATDKIASHI